MSLQAHLAVQRNPFSTAVPTAKVCDGKTSSSLGERVQTSFQIDNAGSTLTIALSPSWTSAAVWSKQSLTAGNPAATPPVPPTLVPVYGETHSAGRSCTLVKTSNTNLTVNAVQLPDGNEDSLAGADIAMDQINDGEQPDPVAVGSTRFVVKTPANAADRERLVSQGMRITPINNSENNNGWFEAVRIPTSYSMEDMLLFRTGGTWADLEDYSTGIINVSPGKFEAGVFGSLDWVNQPGYITGKLRDISKHIFYLQTLGDREFTRRKETSIVDTSGADDTIVATGIQRGLTDADQYFDTNFDTVLVRIHTTIASATEKASSVHVHCVQNFEQCFDHQTVFKRFETLTLSNESAVKAVDRSINRDCKPSFIRYAN
jgi:hypothetical protein